MSQTTDKFWRIDPSVAVENYGYNSIKLNAPATSTVVTVKFKGLAGESGYRSLKVDKGGWRYGFVALLKDGTRVYSDMGTAKYAGGKNPEGTLNFGVPANCDKLWLVVSGAPQEHWRHAWDDDNTNDEQWPYQVQFSNTNLLGQANVPATSVPESDRVAVSAYVLSEGRLELGPDTRRAEIRDLTGRMVLTLDAATGRRSVAMRHLPSGLLSLRLQSGDRSVWTTTSLANLPSRR
jgi:hypothetical protein